MKVVTRLIAAAMLIGAPAAFAGTPVAVTTVNRNVTAQTSTTNKGIRVGGSVTRTLGLGSSGGTIRVCVFSPEGQMVSCKTTRVTYPNRRPIVHSRVGHYSTIVQAAPGSTIRVGGCSHC
jgi:hypothetical protein